MLGGHKRVVVARDIPGIQVPSGEHVTINEGTDVHIMQHLGGTITIRSEFGEMARISEEHADALGIEIEKAERTDDGGEFSEEAVWRELKSCYDPEIPVNIVELGLIYGCNIDQQPDGSRLVKVEMTLTAPGCGMGDVLQRDIETKIGRLPGVYDVLVDLVMDPPWNPSMMSEEARLELGFM